MEPYKSEGIPYLAVKAESRGDNARASFSRASSWERGGPRADIPCSSRVSACVLLKLLLETWSYRFAEEQLEFRIRRMDLCSMRVSPPTFGATQLCCCGTSCVVPTAVLFRTCCRTCVGISASRAEFRDATTSASFLRVRNYTFQGISCKNTAACPPMEK